MLSFVFSLHLIAHFDSGSPDFQYLVNVPWIPSFGISYHMGVDGISVFLILLTTVLTPLAMLASWSITERTKEYFIFMLLLETGMIGVFASLDLFLFYVFWEVMLIPMYFLIGVWGGDRRIYAAMKFVLYTMIGGVLMLVAIISLYFLHGNATGDLHIQLSGNPQCADDRTTGADAECRAACCFWHSFSRSPSRCRSSLSTRGCPMHTSKRRPQDRCCWRASC